MNWQREKRIRFYLAKKRGNPIFPTPKATLQEPTIGEILQKQARVSLPKLQICPKAVWIGESNLLLGIDHKLRLHILTILTLLATIKFLILFFFF